MSELLENPNLDACGCCESGAAETKIHNRPGLPSLAYRFHTHGSALAAMKARLAEPLVAALEEDGEPKTRETYPLKNLTTRSTDDPAIALLDAWAAVTDVLTFYQERIANEGYLRTAAQRRSVLELARAIGYELNPGVAADCDLAFTVESAEGAPESATVAKGTKVMSIPGQDEKPQIFETVEEIEARAEWNELQPQQTEKQKIAEGLKELYLEGVDTNLKAGDVLLIVGKERVEDPTCENWDMRRILTVETDTDKDLTKVTWEKGLGWKKFGKKILPAEKDVAVYTFRQRAALFGHNAPDWRVMPESVQDEFISTASAAGTKKAAAKRASGGTASVPADASAGALHEVSGTILAAVQYTDWPDFTISSVASPETETIHLDNVYPKITAGGWLILSIPSYQEVYQVVSAVEDSRADFTLTAKTTRIKLKGENLKEKFDDHIRDAVVFAESEELELAEKPLPEPVHGDRIALDVLSPDLDEGQAVVVSGKLQRIRLAPDADPVTLLSADGTQSATLNPDDSLRVAGPPLLIRTGGQEPVALEPEELTAALAASTVQQIQWELIDRDDFIGYATIPTDDVELEAADEDDETVSEIAAINDQTGAVTSDRDRTTIELEESLACCYDRTTVAINANVAPATHGETVSKEALGSGDGAGINQSFPLKKPPLTYVSASTPSGGESTLTVKVDGVQWTEVSSLYGLDGTSRSYVVHHDDDQEASAIFGDGKSGARLPSGSENVVATYRSGIGSDGNVDAGKLTLLMTRPLGIRGVTNPLAAGGGTDAEELEDARDNAPLTVLTLDRIVSLRDFEDFARAFSGIAKARAVSLWNGHTHLVHITVATSEEESLDPKSKLYKNLTAAIDLARDPIQQVVVTGYVPRTFSLSAGLILDSQYDSDDVIAGAADALEEEFSFAKRCFGQPVTAAEVVKALQSTAGVIAVDIDSLTLDAVSQKGSATQTKSKYTLPGVSPWKNTKVEPVPVPQSSAASTSLLPADSADFDIDNGRIELAELLLINEQGIHLYPKEKSS
jgi:hypothetical protein